MASTADLVVIATFSGDRGAILSGVPHNLPMTAAIGLQPTFDASTLGAWRSRWRCDLDHIIGEEVRKGGRAECERDDISRRVLARAVRRAAVLSVETASSGVARACGERDRHGGVSVESPGPERWSPAS